MTNINCTGDCKYQKDGKCTMVLPLSSGHSNGICAYYSPVQNAEDKPNLRGAREYNDK